MNNLSRWPTTTIKGSSYLKGRIGWQGLKASEFTDHGPFLITGTDFVGGRIKWGTCYHVTEERFREAEYIHVRNGDLLITKDGTIGKVAYVVDCPPKVVLNSGIFLLRCSDGSYEHRYLYQLLKSHIFDKFLRVYLAGSTINHLYQNVFERFNFPIPNIRVQRRIAEILSTLDDAIEQTEALIAKRQQIKAGLMHDLFTRGVTPDGHLRPTREQAPDLYKESPLGWLPKEWVAWPLRDLTIKIADRDHTTPEYVADGVIMVSPTNLFDDEGIDFAACRNIPLRDHLINRKKTDIESDDLILHRIGAGLGAVRLVTDDMPEFSILHSMALVRPLRSAVSAEYLLWSFRSYPVLLQMDIGTQSIGVPDLGLDKIGSLLFPVAPHGEQAMIANSLRTQTAASNAERNRLIKLRQQKHGLMHDLLTGIVRVKIEQASAESADG